MGLKPSPPGGILRRSAYIRIAGVAVFVSIVLVGFALRYGGEGLVVSRRTNDPNVIVVLASHEWERLPVAAALARRYGAAQVLLTLPAKISGHNCYKCSERRTWLSEAGVDADRITVLPQGVANTYDEAKATAAFARRNRTDRLVVVTSPYHARRALVTFRHLFDSVGVRADIGLATPSSGVVPTQWWLRSYDRKYVTYEWAAIVFYAIRFGISPVVWATE